MLFPFVLIAQTVEDGIQAQNIRDFKKAKEIYEQVLKENPKHPEANYRLGLIFIQRKYQDIDRAVDCMEIAVEAAPNNADYQFGYGAALGQKAQKASVFTQVGLARDTKKAFEKCVELNPNHIQGRTALCQYYVMAPGILGGSWEKAYQQVDSVIRLDEVQGRMLKSWVYEREKKLDEAEKELRTLTVKFPKEWRTWRALGRFFDHQKKNDDAIKAYRKYVELKSDTVDSHYNLGNAYLTRGSVDEALEAFQKAVAINKEFVFAYYAMARTYEKKGDKQRAKDYYQQGGALDDDADRKKEMEKKANEL
jgi:tetratricopeptide (TPR) repeat protein